jgi:hypothetical protein
MVFVAFACFLQADLPGDMCGSSVIMLRTFVFVCSWPPFRLLRLSNPLVHRLMEWDVTGCSLPFCINYHTQHYSDWSQKCHRQNLGGVSIQ